MVIQELETTVRSGANLTVVVKNNSNMHFIKDDQRLFFDGRYIFTEFTELDYAEIARAFGCVGIRVENSGEPDSALSDAMHDNETVVIDVRIPDDAVSERVSLQSVS